MNWIPVFKTGKHTANSGAEFDATKEVLDKIIEMNKAREYPLAIGHPKTNSPAWGWANELKRVGEILYAKPKSLVAEFKAAFDKGMYKKRSLSLNPDLTIRHIGFLGAMPPAVEGLPDFSFSASPDETVIEFSMAEAYALQDVGSIFQRLREWLIEKFDIDTADRVVGQWQIDSLKSIKPEEMPAPTAFSKPVKEEHMPKTVQELEDELAAERAKVAEFSKTQEKNVQLEADLKAERQKNQVAEFSAFCTSDEMKKKISPAMMPQVIDFMQLLSGTETFEFSAPDPADKAKTVKVKKAPVEAFKEFCKAHLPDIIEFSEVATKGKASGSQADMTDPQEIAKKAVEFQMSEEKAGRTITIDQAVAHVTKK